MDALRGAFASECAGCLRTIRALHPSSSSDRSDRSPAEPLLLQQLLRQVDSAFGAAVAVTDRVARGSAFETRLQALRNQAKAAAKQAQLHKCAEALNQARLLLASFHADAPECQPASGAPPGAYVAAYARPQDALEEDSREGSISTEQQAALSDRCRWRSPQRSRSFENTQVLFWSNKCFTGLYCFPFWFSIQLRRPIGNNCSWTSCRQSWPR